MGCVGSAVVNSEAASGKAPCVNTEKQNKFNLGGGGGGGYSFEVFLVWSGL